MAPDEVFDKLQEGISKMLVPGSDPPILNDEGLKVLVRSIAKGDPFTGLAGQDGGKQYLPEDESTVEVSLPGGSKISGTVRHYGTSIHMARRVIEASSHAADDLFVPSFLHAIGQHMKVDVAQIVLLSGFAGRGANRNTDEVLSLQRGLLAQIPDVRWINTDAKDPNELADSCQALTALIKSTAPPEAKPNLEFMVPVAAHGQVLVDRLISAGFKARRAPWLRDIIVCGDLRGLAFYIPAATLKLVPAAEILETNMTLALSVLLIHPELFGAIQINY